MIKETLPGNSGFKGHAYTLFKLEKIVATFFFGNVT